MILIQCIPTSINIFMLYPKEDFADDIDEKVTGHARDRVTISTRDKLCKELTLEPC
jgi:hypothetical protein